MSIPSVIVPPPPYQSPFTSQNGLITPTWSKWIQQLYLRAGGASSPSTTGFASAITTLQANVGTIQTEITTLITEVASLTSEINDLNLGRDL